MNKITEALLRKVSAWQGTFTGAFNIRENGGCAGRRSTEHIQITDRADGQGLVIRIASEAQQETATIPACVTHGAVEDVAYNDFYIAPGADVTIVAGCGVHNDDEQGASHQGIHRFFVEAGAHVLYQEKHLATGAGQGQKRIDPVTDIVLAENARMEIETLQLGGVERSLRKTSAVLAAGAELVIHESILTDGTEQAETEFTVTLEGQDAHANLISRAVARGCSRQTYRSHIQGSCRSRGHSACDAILAEQGLVSASPTLVAGHVDCQLIHEAAIGKIAGEQIDKLCTLGLTREQAEEQIITGFLQG